MSGIEIAMAVGGLMSMGGKIASGIGQANASAKDAELKNKQADEILLRNQENAVILQEKAAVMRSGYETGVAAQGSASPGIGGELQIQKYTNEQIANATQEATFNAAMTRAGAAMESQLASEQAAAGIISGVGGALTDTMRAYNTISPPSGSAPSVPTGKTVSSPGSVATSILTPNTSTSYPSSGSSLPDWKPLGK